MIKRYPVAEVNATMTRESAFESIRRCMPRGATVYTVNRHASRSNDTLALCPVTFALDNGAMSPRWPVWATARVLGLPVWVIYGREAVAYPRRRYDFSGDMGESMIREIARAVHGMPDALKHVPL